MKKNHGFTLIETLVYLALFAILFSGAVVAAYNLFEGNSREQTRVLMQEEGDFLVGKINWVLSGVKSVETPAVGISDNTLSVTKWDLPLNPVVVGLIGNDMTISKGGASPVVLNNTNTAVSGLSFTQYYSGGTNPRSVSFSFTLASVTPNGIQVVQNFSSEKFLRK